MARAGHVSPPSATGAVISDESAHLLARHGARLVHSAPAPGIQDRGSDSNHSVSLPAYGWAPPALAIASNLSDVLAPLDAVGDVVAILGVTFTEALVPPAARADPPPAGTESRHIGAGDSALRGTSAPIGLQPGPDPLR